jgi:hypothetical protein
MKSAGMGTGSVLMHISTLELLNIRFFLEVSLTLSGRLNSLLSILPLLAFFIQGEK